MVLNPTNRLGRVGVGIMIAHDPLHGSGQAAFPHPALTLGDNAHAAERIRMIDANRRQPADDESMHPIPRDMAGLAATQKCAVPGHAAIATVPSNYG